MKTKSSGWSGLSKYGQGEKTETENETETKAKYVNRRRRGRETQSVPGEVEEEAEWEARAGKTFGIWQSAFAPRSWHSMIMPEAQGKRRGHEREGRVGHCPRSTEADKCNAKSSMEDGKMRAKGSMHDFLFLRPLPAAMGKLEKRINK